MLSKLATLLAIFMSEQPTRKRNEEESTIEFAHEDFLRHNIPWAGKTPSALSPVSPSLTACVQYTMQGNIS